MASLLSPAMMVIGFFLWEGAWKGSGFTLNVVKGSIASVIFVFTVSLSERGLTRLESASTESISFLLLSSFLGIVIGDSMWLEALTSIGARRVIIIDSIKPGLGALLGSALLGEPYGLNTVLGLILSTVGILMVCLEEKKEDDTVEEATNASNLRKNVSGEQGAIDSRFLWGYIYAVLNVLFDVYGSVLTKEYGLEEDFNTFELNLVRFGSASLCLLWFMGVANLLHQATLKSGSTKDENDEEEGTGLIEMNKMAISESENIQDSAYVARIERKWFEIPDQSPRNWGLVAGGVFCVTYVANSLSNFALLETEMSVCLTLTSIGPLISLPVGYFFKNEAITNRAFLGTLSSVAGIVILTMS